MHKIQVSQTLPEAAIIVHSIKIGQSSDFSVLKITRLLAIILSKKNVKRRLTNYSIGAYIYKRFQDIFRNYTLLFFGKWSKPLKKNKKPDMMKPLRLAPWSLLCSKQNEDVLFNVKCCL